MSAGPVIETERFALWRPQLADLAGMCAVVADEETRRFLGRIPPTEQGQWERLMRNAGSWLLHGYGTFMVREKGGDDILATCGVFHSWRGFGADTGMDDVPEAGWIVRRDWWRRGVAGEVMDAVVAWFDATHGPRRVACMIEEGNAGSEKVAARLGFRHYRAHVIDEPEGKVTLNLYERLPD